MASQAFLEQAYLAYFGRPADPTGLLSFVNVSEEDVEAAFYASPESIALYGTEFGANQINAIYNMLFARDAEPAGLIYWSYQVAFGLLTPAGAAVAILNGALNEDAVFVANKLATSHAFTAALDTTPELLGYVGEAAAASARAFLQTVTTEPATQEQVDAAVAVSTGVGGQPGLNFTLTTGVDTVNGTAGDDTFIGIDDGTTSTTVTLGDSLKGGEGDDVFRVYTENDFLNLAKVTTAGIEKLEVINALADWSEIDIGGREFNEIVLDVGGLESGGLDVSNVLASSAITLTNIEADDEDNSINFKTDTTSEVGNIDVTVSNVDMSSDFEFFDVYSAFTAATTVNTMVTLRNITDDENGDDGDYIHNLDTGATEGVMVNATFNVENVVNADNFYVEFNVMQAGGSVSNVTVNMTDTDNVEMWVYLDDDGNGTSTTDVATLNLSGVGNSNEVAEFYVTDAETFNVNVLTDSELENIGDYYNGDSTLMGATVVNVNATGNLTVGFWDLNDDSGTTENTLFTITGAGNVTIDDLDDGSSNVTVNASTATGNISIGEIEPEVLSVTTNTGDDWLELDGGATDNKTVISTGAGDDAVLIGLVDYGAAGAKTIDGGADTDTIGISDGALLSTASAANISNFEVLDITGSNNGVAYDMSKEASLTAVVGSGPLGVISLTNAAAGTTVALTASSATDTTVTSLDYALKTATGTSDSFALSLAALDKEKLDDSKDGNLTVSAVTANAIESISIDSSATTTDGTSATKPFGPGDYQNNVTMLTADAVKTLVLTGAADLMIGGVTGTKLTQVDASAMTGQLNIVLGATANISATAVLGGSGGDTIDLTGNVALNNIVVGNGGADTVTLAAGGTKETVRIASDADTVLTLTDTTTPPVTPVVMDKAGGYDAVSNFTSGEDKLELSSALGLGSGDARSAIAGKADMAVDASDNAALAAGLQALIGTGVNFFSDGAVDRAVATSYASGGGGALMAFIDTNNDGDFSNGVDQMVQFTGVATILISDIVFG